MKGELFWGSECLLSIPPGDVSDIATFQAGGEFLDMAASQGYRVIQGGAIV